MAVDTSSAASGAASGAAAGASFGPYGAAIGGAVGLGASLLGKKRKVKAPDLAALTKQVNQGAETERGIASGLKTSLSPLTEAFRTRSEGLSAGLKSDVADRGSAFKTEQANLGGEEANSLSAALRQNVLSAQPEIQRQIREGMAATGGLNRGATNAAFAKAGAAAATEIGQGETEIRQQQLKGLQDASKTVFGADIDAVTRATGMDADTVQTLLNSGREDLIREAQSLIETERTRTSNLLGITQAQNTNNLASQTAGANGQNALLQALIQGGSSIAGSYLGGKGK